MSDSLANQWLDELLDLEDGLTEWEVDFVDSLDQQRRARPDWTPTERQREVLERVYDQRIGDRR